MLRLVSQQVAYPFRRQGDLSMIDPQATPGQYIKLMLFVAVLGLISALVTFITEVVLTPMVRAISRMPMPFA